MRFFSERRVRSVSVRILDITPAISPRLGVWPADTPASREVLLDIAAGAAVTLSTLRATVHLGAHADAPSHYDAAGATIDEVSLDAYLGPCRVVRVGVPRATRVTPQAFDAALSGGGGGRRAASADLPPRVLVATETFPDPNHWNNDFAALAPELVDRLSERGVRLVGIDTPSVDLMDDAALAAHRRFRAHEMAILEGLKLGGVPAGDYELIALPLPLVGFDASPVRAVLIERG